MNDWKIEYRLHSYTSEYKNKLASAQRIIASVPINAVGVAVSCGKDSTVLLDVVAKAYGAKPFAYHIPNPAALPGTEKVLSWYGENAILAVGETVSLAEYIAAIHTWGLPHERTDVEQNRFVTGRKKLVGTEWAKSRDMSYIFLGMRASESKQRAFLNVAPRFKARGITHVCPLYNWTARDIWAYIVANDLPYLPLYDCETHGYTRETIRNSGFLTTDSLKGTKNNSYVAWLASHYPKHYHVIQREFPQIARWK